MYERQRRTLALRCQTRQLGAFLLQEIVLPLIVIKPVFIMPPPAVAPVKVLLVIVVAPPLVAT